MFTLIIATGYDWYDLKFDNASADTKTILLWTPFEKHKHTEVK